MFWFSVHMDGINNQSFISSGDYTCYFTTHWKIRECSQRLCKVLNVYGNKQHRK
jgi:hypothetical protein